MADDNKRREKSIATIVAQGGDGDITFTCDTCMHAKDCPDAFDLECEAPVCIRGRVFSFNAGGGVGLELRDIGDGLWEVLDASSGRALTPPMFVPDLVLLAETLMKPSMAVGSMSREERHRVDLFRAHGLSFVKGHKAGMLFERLASDDQRAVLEKERDDAMRARARCGSLSLAGPELNAAWMDPQVGPAAWAKIEWGEAVAERLYPDNGLIVREVSS